MKLLSALLELSLPAPPVLVSGPIFELPYNREGLKGSGLTLDLRPGAKAGARL